MNEIDVEIYLKQLRTFFETNPNDLIDLIGDAQKELFFEKIKNFCFDKLSKKEDFILTKEDIMDIVLGLKFGDNTVLTTTNINKLFNKTNFGFICLN